MDRLAWARRCRCGAQSAPSGKRPLSYDTYDAWWSIQGTTLSRDGQWLAYALTSQGLDGQLVVRNLQTGQEFRHPRGTGPSFTPNGKFVAFTIAQTKADEEKERIAGRGRGGEGGGERGGGEGGQGRGDAEHASQDVAAGIMTLATGQVATVERVGTSACPRNRRRGSRCTARRGGAGRGGRGAARPEDAADAAASRRAGGAAPAPRRAKRRRDGAARAKRKDNGSDLIVRNLETGRKRRFRSSATSPGRATAGGSPTPSRRQRPRRTARSRAR